MPIIGSQGALRQLISDSASPKNQLFFNEALGVRWTGTNAGGTSTKGSFKFSSTGNIVQIGCSGSSFASFAVNYIGNTISQSSWFTTSVVSGSYLTASSASKNGVCNIGRSLDVTIPTNPHKCSLATPNGTGVSLVLSSSPTEQQVKPFINTMYVDDSNDTYIGGYGATTIQSDGSTFPFIAKIDNGGSIHWQRNINPNTSVSNNRTGTIHAIVTDSSGNVYAHGFFYGTNPDSTTYYYVKFVTKLNNDGTIAWIKNNTVTTTTPNPTYLSTYRFNPGIFFVGSEYYIADANALIKGSSLTGNVVTAWGTTNNFAVGTNPLSSSDDIIFVQGSGTVCYIYVYDSSMTFKFSRTLTISSGTLLPYAVALDPMGAIVISVDTGSSIALVRLLSNGTITGDGVYSIGAKTLTYANYGTILITTSYTLNAGGTSGTEGGFTSETTGISSIAPATITKYNFTND